MSFRRNSMIYFFHPERKKLWPFDEITTAVVCSWIKLAGHPLLLYLFDHSRATATEHIERFNIKFIANLLNNLFPSLTLYWGWKRSATRGKRLRGTFYANSLHPSDFSAPLVPFFHLGLLGTIQFTYILYYSFAYSFKLKIAIKIGYSDDIFHFLLWLLLLAESVDKERIGVNYNKNSSRWKSICLSKKEKKKKTKHNNC